jgi:hypothetical protein
VIERFERTEISGAGAIGFRRGGAVHSAVAAFAIGNLPCVFASTTVVMNDGDAGGDDVF